MNQKSNATSVSNTIRLDREIKRRKLKTRMKNSWQLYLLLVLPITYMLVFHYYPMLGLQIAFKRFSPLEGIWGGTYVGLDYFRRFVTSYRFTQIMGNTLILSAYTVVAAVPFPVFLALSLNAVRSKYYKKTVQLVSYMPHFISVVVIVSMMIQIFNPRSGFISVLAGIVGLRIPDLFGQPGAFSHLYVWSNVWQNAGYGSIIYLAALSNVDPQLHEAAIIDGASRFQRVRFIDFPAIIPTASIMFILNMGRVMSIGFEKAFLMQNPLNISSSEIVSTFVYKIGLTGATDYSYATAIGLFNSLINLVLIISANHLSKKTSGSGLF